jgi:polysaccharide export outer membrane protein
MKSGFHGARQPLGEKFRPGRIALAALVTGLFLAVAGCVSTRGGDIPYNVQNFGAPDPLTTMTLQEDYKIAPLDTLSVKVFQVPDLSGNYQVDLMGNIAMPLIGNVKAVNLTTTQLQDSLKQKLSVNYLKNPDVTVGIAQSAGSNITVDGSVNHPGIFPVLGKITLMQAIALAQGIDDTANEKRIAVFRTIDGKRMAAAFDLNAIRKGKEKDPSIYRGDVIIVDGSSAKKAYREVLRSTRLISTFTPFLLL